jgi:hypothetical protein
MTWTKLSDDFSDDCWELSDAAVRLHMEGLVWSNRKLLDCRLAKVEMRWAKRPDAAEELVAAGWWTDNGDHYIIRHHAVYQRSREAVLRQQGVNQENGQKGGRPKGPPRERAPRKRRPKTESVSESVISAVDTKSHSVSVPCGKPQVKTESKSQTPTEMDGSGPDWPGRKGDQLTKSDDENFDEHAPLAEAPATDPDGFPLDGLADSFTPSAEQLRRIDDNVRRGYDS